MNSIRNLLLLIFTCANVYGLAQNTDQVKKKGPADEYARSSISYLLLDFENEKYSGLLNRAINTTMVPSKFDNNELSKKTLKAPYYHVPGGLLTAPNGEKIRQALVADQYALDVVKYWWKIKNDGSYSTSLIEKRGEYNATDEVVSTVDATKVGRARLGDLGLKLIGNSYVLVIDFAEVKSIDDVYDEQDAAARAVAEKQKTEFVAVKRIKNGFQGNLAAYLYKINYPDTVQGYFDASFIDEKRIDLNKLNKIFDQVYSPVILVSTQTAKIEASQPNPGEFLAPTVQQSPDQMMVKLVNDGILKSLDKFETKLEAFRVKTPVTNIDPIRAKIGRKESLKHEKRYFVWQYVESGSGAVVPKRKGVIRAQKVVDNQNDELGNTQESSFYQVGGGKISTGMTLQERKDLGIGLSAGYGSIGFAARADINVGQWADLPVRQLKLYGELIAGGKKFTDVRIPGTVTSTTMYNDINYSQTKFAVGLLKEFQITRNFIGGGHIGWTMETITWDDADANEQLSASGFNWGLRAGMNILVPGLQVIGSINGHGYGEATYKSGVEGAEDVPTGVKWADIFPEKSSVSFDLSLRLSF